jgi:NTE family protein
MVKAREAQTNESDETRPASEPPSEPARSTRGNGAGLPRVAIALQGGGSHAAFSAGVLAHLLSSERRHQFRLVALSGTSGGAMCASLVWRGLVSGGPEQACERLLGFWRELAADDPADAIANFWNTWFARLPVTVDVSTYLAEPLAEPVLRTLLRTHLDLGGLPPEARLAAPKLFIGATDVLNGERVIFEGQCLDYDQVIASAAVPPLFRAVNVAGRLCWDGIFTSNPPVREFLTDVEHSPDEIWVVQINPNRRTREPRSIREIKDRSNELSGNLSLSQELHFVDTINKLVSSHESLRGKYKHVRLRVVELDDETLDLPSKLDRGSALIERLIAAGRERAEAFFDESSEWSSSGPPRHSVVVSSERPASHPEELRSAG